MPFLNAAEIAKKFNRPIIRINTSEYADKADVISRRILQLDNPNQSNQDYDRSYGINVTSNEIGEIDTLQQLSKAKAPRGACHIGVSSWFNLDIMAVRKTGRGIIFDTNPDNSLLFDHTFVCLRESATKEIFIKKIKQRLAEYRFDLLAADSTNAQRIFCSPNMLKGDMLAGAEEVDFHAKKVMGWLATEENYQHIRQLVLRNKIVAFTGDIRVTAVFKKIRRLLSDNHITVDTLYFSNIHNYVKDTQDAYMQTFQCLSDPEALLIDAEHTKAVDSLTQRVIACESLQSVKQQVAHWFTEIKFDLSTPEYQEYLKSIKELEARCGIQMGGQEDTRRRSGFGLFHSSAQSQSGGGDAQSPTSHKRPGPTSDDTLRYQQVKTMLAMLMVIFGLAAINYFVGEVFISNSSMELGL